MCRSSIKQIKLLNYSQYKELNIHLSNSLQILKSIDHRCTYLLKILASSYTVCLLYTIQLLVLVAILHSSCWFVAQAIVLGSADTKISIYIYMCIYIHVYLTTCIKDNYNYTCVYTLTLFLIAHTTILVTNVIITKITF